MVTDGGFGAQLAPARRSGTRKTRPPTHHATLVPGETVRDGVSGERFRILSLLAEGGMGRVFRAERSSSGELCAVKCQRPIDAGNKALRLRMENEARFLKVISGRPHVCPVYGGGVRDDGLVWIAMELLDGASVGQLLEVLPRFPLVWALEVTRAVCLGLSAARGQAIHRDIKPENVFVTRAGGVYVLDWGAGKFYGGGRLTTTGTTLGTIVFMSPEQLTDPETITPISDLFATGITFFLMLTGKHPFDIDGPLQGNTWAIANRILQGHLRPCGKLFRGMPRWAEEVVLKFLQHDPAHRHRNVLEAAEVMDAALRKLEADIGPMPPLKTLFEAYDREMAIATPDAATPPPSSGAAAVVEEAAAVVEESARVVAGGTVRMAVGGGTVPMAAVGSLPREQPPEAAPPDVAPAAPPAEATADPDGSEDGGEGEQAAEEPARVVRPARVRLSDEERTARALRHIEVLGEHDHPAARETLVMVLNTYDDAPLLRAAAATALARIGDESCLEALEIRTAYDLHPVVRLVADDARAAILDRLGDPDRPRTFAPMDLPAKPPAAGGGAGPRESDPATDRPAHPEQPPVRRLALARWYAWFLSGATRLEQIALIVLGTCMLLMLLLHLVLALRGDTRSWFYWGLLTDAPSDAESSKKGNVHEHFFSPPSAPARSGRCAVRPAGARKST